MAPGRGACHMSAMSTETTTYPYTLDVMPCEKPAGHFQWTLRRHGKLIQRSDRPHQSEKKARENGLAEIERLLTPGRDGR